MRAMFWIICGFLAEFVNLALAPKISVCGAHPDFLLLVVAVAALIEGKHSALFIALFLGVFSDFMAASMFGCRMTTFLVVSFAANFLKNNTIRYSALLEIVTALSASIIFIITALLFSSIYAANIRYDYFFSWAICYMAVQAVAILPVAFVLKYLCRKIFIKISPRK